MARTSCAYDDRDRAEPLMALALMFVLAALSGLAFFHPALFWFANLFGGGSWTRILHPFIGLFLVSRSRFFMRHWRETTWRDRRRPRMAPAPMARSSARRQASCRRWACTTPARRVFWTMVGLHGRHARHRHACSGAPWFEGLFPVLLMRIAAAVHAVARTVLSSCHDRASTPPSGPGLGARMTRAPSPGWARTAPRLLVPQMTRAQVRARSGVPRGRGAAVAPAPLNCERCDQSTARWPAPPPPSA